MQCDHAFLHVCCNEDDMRAWARHVEEIMLLYGKAVSIIAVLLLSVIRFGLHPITHDGPVSIGTVGCLGQATDRWYQTWSIQIRTCVAGKVMAD